MIGRSDKMTLPEFNIDGLDVKVDTGAYGSSLHCHHMEIIQENGVELLRFQILDPDHPEFDNQFFYSDVFLACT